MLELVPVVLTVVGLFGYGTGLYRLHRRQVRWPVARTICLAAGSLCVVAAVSPPLATHDELFPVHVAQHLLLAMIAPVLLALSAPITLALRVLPLPSRRLLSRVLRSRPLRLLTAGFTALVLNIGGLCLLYLTGLYARAETNDLIHAAVHLHMFLAGCLLSWAVIGIDPTPHRPALTTRLGILIVAGAAHDTLSKLIYAHDLPAGSTVIADRHTGAELMYYGGTVIDLAVATILMAQWWRISGRALDRQHRSALLSH